MVGVSATAMLFAVTVIPAFALATIDANVGVNATATVGSGTITAQTQLSTESSAHTANIVARANQEITRRNAAADLNVDELVALNVVGAVATIRLGVVSDQFCNDCMPLGRRHG